MVTLSLIVWKPPLARAGNFSRRPFWLRLGQVNVQCTIRDAQRAAREGFQCGPQSLPQDCQTNFLVKLIVRFRQIYCTYALCVQMSSFKTLKAHSYICGLCARSI